MQWQRIKRGSAGMFGVEIYKRNNDNIESDIQDRYFVKFYVYDTVVKLSGHPEVIMKKLQELLDVVWASMETIYKDAEDSKALREIEKIKKESEKEYIEKAIRDATRDEK